MYGVLCVCEWVGCGVSCFESSSEPDSASEVNLQRGLRVITL
jgi:hypothetical protein